MNGGAAILTLNAGSSSLKFALYAAPDAPGGEPVEIRRGVVEGVGAGGRSQADAFAEILAASGAAPIAAVGHRIVHGGVHFAAPVRLDDAALATLATLEPFAPLHQPHNLAGVRAARAAVPDAVQVGCFDTAFHRGHPFVNDVFALPRRFYEEGVRRYGFHGLSYEYVSRRLCAEDEGLGHSRVVIAHLGAGASICALKNAASVGSTMGFSALDGLPMGTRSGQIDPGVLLYLMDQKGMSAAEITTLLYKESGLKGLSGVSHDMRTLEASRDPRAAEAIDYFVFRLRRELGAMAAVLGGIDALVFTGGIGENSVAIRRRVCEDMAWLDLDLDEAANAEPGSDDLVQISAETSRVRVFRIKTDEERVIARAAVAAL